jgi:hypothetical protein
MSHADLCCGKEMVVLSEDESTDTDVQVIPTGNLLVTQETLSLDSKVLGKQLQQQQEKEHLHAEFPRENDLPLNGSKSDIQKARRNTKWKENSKLKVEAVKQLLESDSSSEDEMVDSFFCEFSVPLSRRLQRLCPTRGIPDNDVIRRKFDGKPNAAMENPVHEHFKESNCHREESDYSEDDEVLIVSSSYDGCFSEEKNSVHISQGKKNLATMKRKGLIL